VFSVVKVIAHSRRPNKVVVCFSEPVVQQNPADTDDALNPANYVISQASLHPQEPVAISVETVNPYVVQLTVNKVHIDGYPYSLTVYNVKSVTGETIEGSPQLLHGRGLSSRFAGGIGSLDFTIYGLGLPSRFSAGIGTIFNATTYFYDNVSRPVGGGVGNADSGQPWVASGGSSLDWDVLSVSGHKGLGQGVAAGDVTLTADTGNNNGKWRVRNGNPQTPGTDNWMWIIRGVDDQNFIGIYQFAGNVSVWKRVAGTFTKLTSDFAHTSTADTIYEAYTDSDDVIAVWVNGTLAFVLHETANNTGTHTGIWAGGGGIAGVTFDDWLQKNFANAEFGDTFTRADGSIFGTPAQFGTGTWDINSGYGGTWNVSSNELVAPSSETNNAAMVQEDSGSGNGAFTITVDNLQGGSYFGPYFRGNSTNNFINLQFGPGSGAGTLYLVTYFSLTPLNGTVVQSAPATVNNGDRIKAFYGGTRIVGVVNNTVVIDYNVATGYEAFTYIGIADFLDSGAAQNKFLNYYGFNIT